MKLFYLALPNGKKLIPYHRRDYKSKEIEGVYYFIDGDNWSYIRTSHPNLLKQTSVNALISTIREEFKWTSIYNEDLTKREVPVTRLLKNLEEDHIHSIINYLKDRIKKVNSQEAIGDAIQNMKQTIEIMRAELRFRTKQNKTQ